MVRCSALDNLAGICASIYRNNQDSIFTMDDSKLRYITATTRSGIMILKILSHKLPLLLNMQNSKPLLTEQ